MSASSDRPERIRRIHYAWVIAGVATLAVLGALGLARFGYTLLLPEMQAAMGLSNAETGALATANLAGYTVLSAIGGALAARFGPRAVIALGLATAGAGMALTGLAGGFLPAAAYRALTGLGSGAANVGAMGLLAAWFAARRRGLAAGIAVSGSSLGLIALGPLVPRLVEAYGERGWRISWFLLGAAAFGLAAAAGIFLRNRPAALGLEPLGVVPGSVPAAAPAEPLRWRDVYRSGRVWHLGLVYTAFGFSYIIYMTFFTRHLTGECGYSRTDAGSLFMTMGWVSLSCGLLWGTVSDRIGRKWALVLVYIIQAAAFALFARPEPAVLTVSAVLFGLTAWSIPAIMAAACGDVLGPRMAPAALGFVTLFFGIGQAVSPSIAGAIADREKSFSPAFLLAAAVALLGAVMASVLRAAPRPGRV
jgi:MFS family permease